MTPKLRVLSYNIHKGFSTGSRSFVLSAIKEAIRTVDADLVFLQEVLGEHQGHAQNIKDWPSTSQFEFLADSLWPHHAYGRNAVFDAGHHGNAILSKFRIMKWSNEDVSTNRLERRGILHVELKIPNLPEHLHCLCVHMGLTRRGRKIQLQRLCKKIEMSVPESAPLLIGGDFNDWGIIASKVLHAKLGMVEVFKHSRGRHAATFPSFFPFLHLDRIYVRGLEVHAARVLRGKPWKKLSDHAALYSELTLDLNSLGQ